MRIVLIIFIFSCLHSYGQVPSYVPIDSLHAWYGFNGNASDETLGTNDGQINGALLVSDRFGNVNSAYSFDGIDDNIEIAPFFNGTGSQTGVSYSYWVMGSPEPSGYALSYSSYLREQNGQVNNGVVSHYANHYTGGLGISGGQVGDGQWHHIVCTFEPYYFKLYVDATLVDSTWSPGATSLSFTIDLTSPGTGLNRIGSRTHPSCFWDCDFFSGAIDDIGVWNKTLTQCEIIELYTTQVCNVGIEELASVEKELLNIVDLMGRETTPQKNMVLIYVYSDGTTERVFEFE